ncbi:DivIVA domain-containing protein [Actinoplanes sp. NPDC051861]|uniref:DivIVA domain-containing protein n=1 Tax=Actinoplanes sp. NPDC051861 TaxID=3155170 RepID=UPI003434DDAA
MPLTPADVDNVEFRVPQAGARGYDEVEVDAFLDAIAAEMRRLTAENQALSEQAGRAEATELSVLAERLQRLRESCARAENEARAVQSELEQARAEAAARPPAAVPAIAGVLELAQRTADEHLTEARQEADTVLRQATTKAAQLTSDAELRASTLIADARHGHSERLAGITAKRAAALEEIEDLTKFAQRYREGLSNLVTDRLDELTGKSRKDERKAIEAPKARTA